MIDSSTQPENDPSVTAITITRRKALTAAVTHSLLLTPFVSSSSTAQAAPLLPILSSSNGGTSLAAPYKPAKRSTAYLVDSTIPPTLVPFRASREAAVLKNIGMGLGTAKTPYVEDEITLNNMMNKGVFGTIDLVREVTGQTPSEDGTRKKVGGAGYASFVFLGVTDYSSAENTTSSEWLDDLEQDVQLAVSVLIDITKPRRGLDTTIALAFAPQSTQGALDKYVRTASSTSGTTATEGNGRVIEDVSEETLIQAMMDAQVPRNVVISQLPILRFAKAKRLGLLAVSPEIQDVTTVRREGLQNVDLGRRSKYVVDTEGFINLTQDPGFRLYTEKSLMKDFDPLNDNDQPGDYFAERILVHEAIATAIAQYAILRPDSLVITVAPIKDVRFMGGPNGRIPRICKYLSPDSTIDEEAVTTILLNPSAKETLSLSKFLRLEIGTAPKNLQYQTKVADYLWFSTMPKVNMVSLRPD